MWQCKDWLTEFFDADNEVRAVWFAPISPAIIAVTIMVAPPRAPSVGALRMRNPHCRGPQPPALDPLPQSMEANYEISV